MPFIPAVRGPLTRTLQLIFLFNLFLLLYYVVADYQFVFHADSAAKNLLAEEVWRTGQFFPHDWNYVNSDLWVFYTHLFIIPLLNFFPNGYGLHAASGLLTSALVLFGTWLISGVAGLSRPARLAVLALFAAGISPNMVENLYGQGAYGTMYYSGCFLLYFSWRCLQGNSRWRWLWGAAAAAATLLLFCANPQRAAIYYGLPLASGVLALLLWRRRPGNGDLARPAHALGLLALCAAAALLGVLAHKITLGHVNSTAGLTQAQWLSFEQMRQAVLGTVQGLLSLLAGLPPAGSPVIGARGALLALRMIAAFVLLAVLPWALLRSLNWQQPGRLFFAAATASAMAVCLLISVSTSIPVPSAPESSIRYLVPALLGMLILLVGVVSDQARAPLRLRLAGGAALAALILTAPLAYQLPESPGYFPAEGIARNNPKQRLADFLSAQGLRYGYATFWNAGLNTVLSAGKSRVRQIEIVDGLPLPRRHLASDAWYQPQAWQGPTFLLLGPEEARTIDWPRLTALTGQPSRSLVSEGWQVFVFEHNIAADLAQWDLTVGRPIDYPVSAASPHSTGHFDPARQALSAGPGEAGALLFGPTRRMLPGRYQASIEIEASGEGELGQIDAVSSAGRVSHAASVLHAGARQRLLLPFSLDRRVNDMEFRVLSNGRGQLRVHQVQLRALPAEPAPAPVQPKSTSK